ncbi:PrsW family intramembrane metalloprotease [Bacillus salacetis]|uniref:Protease PrsW n=1 Tax=Bacillus salacetis TaxID=2315464 RepID=A0A3A1QT81_9BACI|nr:glutamic-type intramembrane protease PrsW [Bacillus salacetis]RIW28017.1 PrsW family intramembrane metalloprotease [Bacillus salacetis]
MLVILSAGFAPGLALLSYFYLRDEFESEPVSFIVKTFMYGAVLTFPIMFLQYVLQAESIIDSPWMNAYFSAGFLEEFFKWFILFFAVYQHVEFNDPYDGIIYGASVSLGFATVENILYLLAHGVEFAIGRALLPVSAHALFGVVMGYYLGKAKFAGQQSKLKRIYVSLFLPFALHGTYDFILGTGRNWIFYMIPFMLFLWWTGIRKIKSANRLTSTHYNQKELNKKMSI